MPTRQFLRAIDVTDIAFYTLYDIVFIVIIATLLRLLVRSPKAQEHRRWGIPFLVATTLQLLIRIAADIRYFGGVRWHAAPVLALHLAGWLSSLVWLYTVVQLFKVFRALAQRHADQRFADLPFEEWPADAAPVAANLWDTSRA